MTAFVTLVRHGQTAHNAERRFQGGLPVPLDVTGRAQASAVARRLAAFEPPVTRVYASDMLRARETADIIAGTLSLPVHESSELREVHLGNWEGLLYDEVTQRDPDRWALWTTGHPDVAPEGGETMREVSSRMHACFSRVHPRVAGEHVVLVTHGVAITALLCRLLGWDFAEAWGDARGLHRNTAITHLKVEPERGTVTPVVLACARHLGDVAV